MSKILRNEIFPFFPLAELDHSTQDETDGGPIHNSKNTLTRVTISKQERQQHHQYDQVPREDPVNGRQHHRRSRNATTHLQSTNFTI